MTDENLKEPCRYLPHRSPMLLIDKAIHVSLDEVRAQTDAQSPLIKPFLDKQGLLPSWYALELMAQCVGIFAGYMREMRNLDPIKAGFIISCRRLKTAAPVFDKEGIILLQASLLMQSDGFASFDCKAVQNDKVQASGRLSLYEPKENELALSEFKQH